MDFLKKCCQCYWCGYAACNTAMCIDQWHSIEACGLAYLYCDACCWTLCAPLCIDCKLGETGKACENCTRGIKYCAFSCALSCVGCCDGLYNCFQVIKVACGEGGVKGFADLTKNTEFIANKVKEALGLETSNEPLRSMGTFTP
jgi:hypothetical protein